MNFVKLYILIRSYLQPYVLEARSSLDAKDHRIDHQLAEVTDVQSLNLSLLDLPCLFHFSPIYRLFPLALGYPCLVTTIEDLPVIL